MAPVSEFLSLDRVMQAPGGVDEDTEGADAFLLGRKTYVIHGNAFEPMEPGDPFGDMMNAPAKYVVSARQESA